MPDRRDDAGTAGDEFGGFLAEVERSITEMFAPEPEPAPPATPAPAPDPRAAAAREAWLDPDRFVDDFVDLAARLAEEPG